MAGFNEVLITMLLILGAVLVIFMIVLCIKLLYTVDRTNDILSNVQKKLNTMNGIFTAVDKVTDAVVSVSDSLVSKVVLLIEKMFKKKDKEEE